LLSRVPDTPKAGPAWLEARRRDAAARVRESGLPHRKVEGWRFTSVKPLERLALEESVDVDLAAAAAWGRDRVGDDGSDRVTVVNGRLVGDRPSSVSTIGEELASGGGLEAVLGALASPEFFSALNASLFDDGVVVRLTGDVETPLHLVHVGEGPTVSWPRVVVVAEEGARARLVETYLTRGRAPHLANAVTEVVVGPRAVLDHTRVVEGSDSSYHVATLAVRQERDSAYASRVVALGGALGRLELDVELAGEGADCVLDGVYHVTGEEHVDHQTRIVHAVPRCTSNERYRGILDGRARAVFNGIVVVERDAQKTNAHQENRNLLLSDDATINTKPHLEIDADDVKCSHGATIGALDEAALFYLRSRGIGETHARNVLTFAFVEALLDRIPTRSVADRLGSALLDRLPQGDLVRDMLS
jgi:Fe-S cluster assembly protein SufD